MRIFIAIQLDNETKNHVRMMADMLDPYFLKARYSRTENYHITLKFIGETDRKGFEKAVNAVKSVSAECSDFSFFTSGPGSFKKGNKHIFFCSTEESAELLKLHDKIQRELIVNGMEIQKGTLTPHITIAREVVLADRYPVIKTEKKLIKVDSICVMESTRINGKLTYIPRYTAKMRGSKNGQ